MYKTLQTKYSLVCFVRQVFVALLLSENSICFQTCLQAYRRLQLNLDYLHSQGLGRVKQMIESLDNPKYEYQ